jgi:hypothetical protein
VIGIPTRRLPVCFVVLALAAAALISSQSGASAAAGNLSSVVLSQSFPFLVASPPGIRNGPITKSSLSLVTGGSNEAALSQFGQQLASGDVSGFVRTWTHQPSNGDAVEIAAFQFQDQTQASSFLDGEQGSLSQQGVISSFAIPSIPGAIVYILHGSASGTPYTQYIAAFGKANIDLTVTLVTVSGDLTASDATQLATQQWDNVPTPMDWAPIVRLVNLVGGVLVTLMIVLLARARRYPAIFTARPITKGIGPWNPPLAAQRQQS